MPRVREIPFSHSRFESRTAAKDSGHGNHKTTPKPPQGRGGGKVNDLRGYALNQGFESDASLYSDGTHVAPAPHPPVAHSSQQPINEYEALMVAGEGEPEPSVAESFALRELLAEAVEGVLDDHEREVVEAVVVERLSLREAARRFGTSKTSIARTRDRGLGKLRQALLTNVTFVEEVRW